MKAARKEAFVDRRFLFSAVAAGCLMAMCGGCAGSHRTAAVRVASQGAAPDDVALRPNPNAPYLMAGETPRLIPRATEMDARNAGPCNPEVLSVEQIAGDSNGLIRSMKLAFMNRGPVACRLGGYPGITLLDPEGANIGSIATEKISSSRVEAELSKAPAPPAETAVPAITLMPHAVAAFQVVWTTGTNCSSVGQIVVTAPGSQRAFTVSQPMRICAGRVQVTELRLDEGDV